MPPQSMLLKVINVTSIDLDLGTWITSGCPIRFFSVLYKVWDDTAWTEVSNNIQSNKVGVKYINQLVQIKISFESFIFMDSIPCGFFLLTRM